MADDHHVEEPEVTPDLPAAERVTAPQSAFSTRQVAVGLVVLLVGLALTFGLGFVLT